MQPNERTTSAGKQVGNKILSSITAKEYALILPHLEFLDMPHHLSLYEPDQPLEFVHFPNAGMVSLVIATEDGRTVEVGEVGREGFAGVQAAVGINKNQVREIVQIAGDGFRVKIGALKSVLQSAPELQRILTRYAVVQGMQFAQTAACNRLHNIEQRLARWLLRFPCDDARDGPTHRKLGSRYLAGQTDYRVHAWCSADSEPRETQRVQLRVLWSYPTV
jgi:CRP-like cAMP-binding protein